MFDLTTVRPLGNSVPVHPAGRSDLVVPQPSGRTDEIRGSVSL